MAAHLSHPIDYWSQVIRLRHFWCSLVANDVKSRYRHSFLGTAWSLGRPIGMTIVLSIVFTNAFNLSGQQYIPFLFLSIALWQFLVESMIAGCNSFRTSAPYIRQQPLPLVVFPLRTVLGASIHAALAVGIGIVVTGVCIGLPSPIILLSAAPGLLLFFVVAFALATIFGLLHTHFTDTLHLTEIGLQALFYLTPVMYRPDFFAARGRLTYVIQCNPFTALLESVRQPLLEGQYPDPAYLLNAAAFAAIVSGLAWLGLQRFEKTLVYWI
jgi:lipopolysaccharide transport system permease protein